MPEQARLEADALLKDPNLAAKVQEDIASLGVAGEHSLSLTIYVVGVSRNLPKPLNARIHGPTSSGKSFILESVSELFPPETIIHATQITPQALFHMPPDSLRNRFIIAGERSRKEDDETAEKNRALRELQASSKLSKLITSKGADGQLVTIHIELEGPISYVETTTNAKVFDEDANRCLTLFTDERPGQTERIVKTLAAKYRGGAKPNDRQQIILRHFAVQRLLQSFPVVVPFAEQLAGLLDYERVELRRGYPQIVSMVQAVTLLHQWQRERDDDGNLVATAADYELARKLLRRPMARLLGGGLSAPASRFFESLKGWTKSFEHADFTPTDAARKFKFSPTAVRGWLWELSDQGLAKIVQDHKGSSPAIWQLTGADPETKVVLPSVEKVCSGDSNFRAFDK